MRRWIWIGVSCGCALLALLAMHRLAPRYDERKLGRYLYEDTRELVMLVEDAGALVERLGTGAFEAFSKPGTRWFDGATYLFVYDPDGNCVFHPVTPELVGKNRMGLRDIDGRPMIAQITDVARRPERDAAGWVFYYWADRTQLTPTWKSSYIRKAVAPDGRVYCVGSGRSDMKVEKALVQERVDRAAALLAKKGKLAVLPELLDRAGPFQFLDTFTFVVDGHGISIVDPAFPTLEPRDITGFQDALGHYVVKEVLAKLEDADSAWVQYMRPKPGTILPSRKLVYVRKVVVAGETLVVGTDFFLATPVWMRL